MENCAEPGQRHLEVEQQPDHEGLSGPASLRASCGSTRRLLTPQLRDTVEHTFRATGITTYLENGGTLEHAQTIANHESPRTTKLYDRTREELSLDEIERIRI